MGKNKLILIIGTFLIIFLSCGESGNDTSSDGSNGNNCEEFIPNYSFDCSKTEDGFCVINKVVDADGCIVDDYKFEDPNAVGTIGGIINQLYFRATQINHKDLNIEDCISLIYYLSGEGAVNLEDIPPEGVKLPIGPQGENENFVSIRYIEEYSDGSYHNIIDSVESNSHLIIYSFEKIGEYLSLLVGSIKCTLLLEDENQMTIEGEFSIPIQEVI